MFLYLFVSRYVLQNKTRYSPQQPKVCVIDSTVHPRFYVHSLSCDPRWFSAWSMTFETPFCRHHKVSPQSANSTTIPFALLYIYEVYSTRSGFFFFSWGKGGKCVMHLSAYGTVCGTPARLADGPYRPLDNLPPDLPTKTYQVRFYAWLSRTFPSRSITHSQKVAQLSKTLAK